jgi:AraC-like DNA-binding protein
VPVKYAMPIAPEIYKKIVTAKLYIDDSFRESIDLDSLAKEACLSRFHFHRLFTSIYRITPHQYLTRKRLEQARQSLAGKKGTVTDICNEVGFESIGSFSTLFKKNIGHPPANYRLLAWQKQEQARQQPRTFIPHCFIEAGVANVPTPEKSNFEEDGPASER